MYLHFTIWPISGTENLIGFRSGETCHLWHIPRHFIQKCNTHSSKGKKKKVSVEYPASDKAGIKRLSMKEAICPERTKRNLTAYFMHQLQKYFHLRNQSFVTTKNGKTVWLWQEKALIHIHEKTDMCIPYCLQKINGNWTSVKVNPNDTNVIVLLVDHPPNLNLNTILHNVECWWHHCYQ